MAALVARTVEIDDPGALLSLLPETTVPEQVSSWVRNGEGGTVQVHAEGDRRAVAELVAFLHEGPRFARVAGVEIEQVAIEGHEQFAIRG